MSENETRNGGEKLPEGKMKSKLLSWLDNFWYHRKWQTLMVLFFAVLITVGTVQMCQKESFDIYVMYAGPAEIDRNKNEGDIMSDYAAALDSLSRVTDDHDGNGKISVSLKDLFLLTDKEISEAEKLDGKELNYNLLLNNKSIFTDTLKFSNYYLCFLSEELYDEYKVIDGVKIFADLSEYRRSEGVRLTEDGCAAYLSSCGFGNAAIFKDMPENTLVCLRRISPMADKFSRKESKIHFARAEEAVKEILTYSK